MATKSVPGTEDDEVDVLRRMVWRLLWWHARADGRKISEIETMSIEQMQAVVREYEGRSGRFWKQKYRWRSRKNHQQ